MQQSNNNQSGEGNDQDEPQTQNKYSKFNIQNGKFKKDVPKVQQESNQKNVLNKKIENCVNHQNRKAEFYCIFPHCEANARVMCQQCILEQPHHLHENMRLQEVFDILQKVNKPLLKIVASFGSFKEDLSHPFENVKQTFLAGIEEVQGHFLKELEPEIKKYDDLEQLIHDLSPKNILRHAMNQRLNGMIVKLLGPEQEREDFLDTLKPDPEKLRLFGVFFNERMVRLHELVQQFIDMLLTTFVQELNYFKFDEQEYLVKKKKMREEEEARRRKEQELKDQLGHTMFTFNVTDLQGKVAALWDGHEQSILTIKSLDMNYIATGSEDFSIRIWDVESRTEFKKLQGHKGSVLCIETADEHHLISASKDKTVKLWNWSAGVCIKTYEWDQQVIVCLKKLKEDVVVHGTERGLVKLWDFRNGIVLTDLLGHYKRVCAIAAVGEEFLATAGADTYIKLWDMNDKVNAKYTLQGHNDAVLDLGVTAKQGVSFLISVGYDGLLIIWNINEGSQVKVIEAHKDAIWKMEVLDVEIVATAGADKAIRIWNWVDEDIQIEMLGHKGDIYCMTTFQNRFLVTSGYDKKIIVWG